ncbi:hypothetical protein J2W76_002133 [Methylorubrum zatmanii]|nr:hypothetical protein [Methylorubrum zatmanii]MCP1554499.1 hypothetical protein [Methylorubrum extorquens]
MALIVLGGVKPVTAMSFGAATAPSLSFGTIASAVF